MNANLHPREPSKKELRLMNHGEYFEYRLRKPGSMQVAVYLHK